jgi:hypothetical protein
MANIPEPSDSEWIRRMRDIARQDAEDLVPRPDFGVLGLAAPVLRPAVLASYSQMNGAWDSISVAYGDPVAATGPYVTVTTAAGPHVTGHGARTELLRAIDSERNRVADQAGVDEEDPAAPPAYERAQLPAGEALICSHGTVWAARLLAGARSAPGQVVVTITGRGVDRGAVRLEPAGDLRPYFEARNEILGQLTERRRRLAPPSLEPAEGVAAFRALAEHTLDQHARLRAATRDQRVPRHRAGDPELYHALWRRAVREQQRVASVDERAANEVVTLVVNHLGQLLEHASWFTDPRLRAAAIDETLRHAMLGEKVRSAPAQRAWARYWTMRMARVSRLAEPAEMLAGARADQPVTAAWLAAWASWAERA